MANESLKKEDADDKKKSTSKAAVFRAPVAVDIQGHQPEAPKTFAESLESIFGRKKAETDGKPEPKLLRLPEVEKPGEPIDTAHEFSSPTDEATAAVEVPLNEVDAEPHDLAIDHTAEALHKGVQRTVPLTAVLPRLDNERVGSRLEDEQEGERPAAAEFVAEMPPAVAESFEIPEVPQTVAAGGGGHEGPPPLGERPGAAEPSPDPEPGSGETLTMPIPERAHAEYAAAAAATPTESAPKVIQHERVVEGNSLLPAAVVGVIDYLGRRRLKRKFNRDQHRQDKKIKQIERKQAEARDQQYRASVEQIQKNQRIQRELDQRPKSAELTPRIEQIQRQRQQGHETNKPRVEHEEVIVKPEEIIEEGRVEVPRDHHLERSAWLTTEVDKSGHAVENPVLAYGQEFQRERHQEARRQEELAAAELVGWSAVSTVLQDGPSQPALPAGHVVQQLPADDEGFATATTGGYSTSRSPDPVNAALAVTLVIIVLAIIAALILR